ncbi:MAG: hypothetical protein ACREGH_03250, partial [Minisyncoccia bacterium]
IVPQTAHANISFSYDSKLMTNASIVLSCFKGGGGILEDEMVSVRRLVMRAFLRKHPDFDPAAYRRREGEIAQEVIQFIAARRGGTTSALIKNGVLITRQDIDRAILARRERLVKRR